MSKTTWILVANSSRARILVNHGPHKGLQLVKEFEHPQSREKAMDLVTDRQGHNQGYGTRRTAYEPQVRPKQNEAEHFALELAKELEQGRVSNSYERLIIVASTPFIGMLNNRLGGHVKELVSETMEKDYTAANDREISAHLEPVIFL